MLLILANVLYYMWDKFATEPDQTGIAVVEESQLGPPLEISLSSVLEAATSVGAALSSGTSSDFAAVVGRSCVSISFRKTGEADSALTAYQDEGMRASRRNSAGQVFIGHWVQIREIPSREVGDGMIETLRVGGISDVFLMEEDGVFKISLGLFGDIERAERIELQARSLDLPADITSRMQEAAIYYVDLALLPGRGAGAMIEQYGEDRILLRDNATCPTSE